MTKTFELTNRQIYDIIIALHKAQQYILRDSHAMNLDETLTSIKRQEGFLLDIYLDRKGVL